MPDPEETTVETPESTPETEEKPGGDKPETATDFLKNGLAKIAETKADETPAETEEPGEEKSPEGEETKPKTEPEETEEIDEAEVLKRAGFTQRSLADLKADSDKERTRVETWNWGAKNIPGFTDFVMQRMQASRGNVATGPETLADFSKTLEKPETPGKVPGGEAILLEKGFTKEQVAEFRDVITALAPDLGLVHRDDIAADKEATANKDAEAEAVGALDDFGKSDQVKEQLEALSLDWKKDVKAEVVKMLLEGFGIDNIGNVTPDNIARAFNAYLQEKPGGIEQLLANVKSKAVKEHEDKLKLGKSIPKTGAVTPSKPDNLDEFLRTASADDIKKRMQSLDKR